MNPPTHANAVSTNANHHSLMLRAHATFFVFFSFTSRTISCDTYPLKPERSSFGADQTGRVGIFYFSYHEGYRHGQDFVYQKPGTSSSMASAIIVETEIECRGEKVLGPSKRKEETLIIKSYKGETGLPECTTKQVSELAVPCRVVGKKGPLYMMMAGTSTLALMLLWGRTLPPLT